MKLIMENWHGFLNEEQLLKEQIEKDFTLLAESLTEWQNKGLLEEGISQEILNKIRQFSRWKNEKIANWIKPALKQLFDISIKLRRAGKLPYTLAKRLRNFISDLMKPDNLVLAASIISIVAGLLIGDATGFAALPDFLDAVDASASLVDAAGHFANAADIKDALVAGAQSTQLTGQMVPAA